MPRSPRADEAGGLYHVLNRGNLRATIFHKDADYEAFERILDEGLELHEVELFCYQLMPNHYHLVLRPLVDGEMSRFMGWVGDEKWVGRTVVRLNLELTIRPRGRQRIRELKPKPNKEA